ncbi:MAG: 2-oxo acid dehydrogenase subunit E2 [Micrococcales bacterium]|nr:2-oxo acid dehydrogenase subunit E2 [Micrococcales bacterium]
MAIKTFNLPDPGEGLVEAEIVEWRVAPGDTVKVNDMVLEVETAKSLVELPIPWAGTVAELLVEVGQTVEVGTPIISIDDGKGGDDASHARATDAVPGPGSPDGQEAILVGYGAKAGASARRPRKQAAAAPPASEVVTATPEVPEPTSPAPRTESPAPAVEARAGDVPRPRAKPPVRKLAKDLGVDLRSVTATGPDGIITREDVTAHAERGPDSAAAEATPAGARGAGPAAYGMPFGSGEREERSPIKGVRKMTAAAMVGSAFTAPHVTEWITFDVTGTMELVDRLRRDREFKDVKVTPLLVLAKALIVAIRRHPGMNATWDEAAQEIVQKNYINLGIAAATPRGLVVPNIKDAHGMSMLELAEAIGALTATAREGRTQPAEMAGGTMTITNVGVFGVDSGTPIINPGESAIVAFGAIRKQPWVVAGPDGSDEIAIRHVTQLAVSFDHRLIDGELGSRFLADLAAILEDPGRGLVWG